MPLSMSEAGKEVTIIRIGGKQELRMHLEDMGFVPGTPIALISVLNGSVIVNIKDTRVAISEEMAKHILVA